MNLEEDVLLKIKSILSSDDIVDSKDIVNMNTLIDLVQNRFKEIRHDFDLSYYKDKVNHIILEEKIDNLYLYGLGFYSTSDYLRFCFSFSLSGGNKHYDLIIKKYRNHDDMKFLLFNYNKTSDFTNEEIALLKKSEEIVYDLYSILLKKAYDIEYTYDEFIKVTNSYISSIVNFRTFLNILGNTIYEYDDDFFHYNIIADLESNLEYSITTKDTSIPNAESVNLFISKNKDELIKKIGIPVSRLKPYYQYLVKNHIKMKNKTLIKAKKGI